MKVRLKAASILTNTEKRWGQTFYQDGLGIIVEIGHYRDDNKAVGEYGRRFIEQIYSLHKQHLTYPVFREKLDNILDNSLAESYDVALSGLRITDEDNPPANKGTFFSNKADVLLAREDKAAILIKDKGSATGKLYAGDRILLINKAGLQFFGHPFLQQVLCKNVSVDDSVEQLLVRVHKDSSLTQIVGLLLQAGPGEDELKPVDSISPRSSPIEPAAAGFRSKIRLSLNKTVRYLKNSLSKKRLLAIMLLSIIVYLGWRFSSVPLATQPEQLEQYELARHKYEEGKALLELNRLRARDVLQESKQGLEDVLGVLEEGQQSYRETVRLLNDVNSALEKARSAFNKTPVEFFDLSLIRDGLTANRMDIKEGKLYIYSREKQLTAELVLETKAHRIINGDDWLADGELFTVSDSEIYVLSDEGVVAAAGSKKVLIERDEEWGRIRALRFFGGNLYLLDAKGAIWKYIPVEDGYSDKRNYFRSDINLQNPISMAIDGSIWVFDSGSILKFVGGERDSFFVRGLEEALGKEAKINKLAAFDNLYVLDKENSRIVVIGEDGSYRSQYQWEGMQGVDDFVVTEDEERVLLLEQDKIYEIELE